MNTQNLLQQFRDAVYQLMPKRADASLDLVDALTVTGHVTSPVALSEEALFRRQFSAVYDVLTEGELESEPLAPVLYAYQPADSDQVAGFEVYAVDTTSHERAAAETLPDRGWLKSQADEAPRVGLKFSWLMRLVKQGTSWVAPWQVQRVATQRTDTDVAVEQVKALDRQSAHPKVVVADSLYGNHLFLAAFQVVKTAFALVRLRGNLSLYERPEPKPARARGAPRKHGAKFKLAAPSRPPDRSETFRLGEQSVRLTAWCGLHLRKLPQLVGLVLRVEFLKPDGTSRYKRPLWLFWTGPQDISLQALCVMYLWRFAIEHAFRFMKQRLGLNANRSSDLVSLDRWMWLCALAYWQLLLMAPHVEDLRPAWHPRREAHDTQWLTPGQVQRGALRFLLKLGTPAADTRPAGKGKGRTKGYRPAPRTRYAVVKKGKNKPRRAKKPAYLVV